MTSEAKNLNVITILSYLNAPLMEIFGGTKDIIENFIVSGYHKGKLYFDKPIEVSDDIIYRLTRLSEKGEPVPVGSNPRLVENLTSTPAGKNSRGLVTSQIQYTTTNIVENIVFVVLTNTANICDLKFDMLEVVDCIVES